MAIAFENAPQTMHRSVDDLPFITVPDGTGLQLIQVDLAVGVRGVDLLPAPH